MRIDYKTWWNWSKKWFGWGWLRTNIPVASSSLLPLSGSSRKSEGDYVRRALGVGLIWFFFIGSRDQLVPSCQIVEGWHLTFSLDHTPCFFLTMTIASLPGPRFTVHFAAQWSEYFHTTTTNALRIIIFYLPPFDRFLCFFLFTRLSEDKRSIFFPLISLQYSHRNFSNQYVHKLGYSELYFMQVVCLLKSLSIW